jgi:hypothetical protein
MAAILKILKTKSTTLSDDLFLCQVSKGSPVRFEFNIFLTLVTMVTAAFMNLFQPLKSCHTVRWIFLQSFMKFDERKPSIFLIPPFLPWQLQKSLSNRFRSFFFGLSRSTRCGCCSLQVSPISDYDHFCVF